MTLWIDAQLSPHLAQWISQSFGIETQSVASLGFRDAEDVSIFQEARAIGAIVMTKDQDFVNLVRQFGPLHKFSWSLVEIRPIGIFALSFNGYSPMFLKFSKQESRL